MGELVDTKDEAVVALRHTQSASENALAAEREKAEAAETSWHAVDRARAARRCSEGL